MREINMNDYQTELSKSDKPVLIDFYAPWCGPCKMVGPIMEELQKEYDGKAEVVKVNVDDENALAQQFGVMSIPTVVLVKGGKVLNKTIGAKGQKHYKDMIEQAL